MEKFAIGLLIGGIGGALLAANNYRMRTLIRKGQEEVKTKLDQIMDEKIKMMEEGVEELKETAEEKAEEIIERKKASKRAAKAE